LLRKEVPGNLEIPGRPRNQGGGATSAVSLKRHGTEGFGKRRGKGGELLVTLSVGLVGNQKRTNETWEMTSNPPRV